MSANRQPCPNGSDALTTGVPPLPSVYVYAGLDDAPLILGFEQQLAQLLERDEMLRRIAALVEFEFACLTRGIDPRTQGRG